MRAIACWGSPPGATLGSSRSNAARSLAATPRRNKPRDGLDPRQVPNWQPPAPAPRNRHPPCKGALRRGRPGTGRVAGAFMRGRGRPAPPEDVGGKNPEPRTRSSRVLEREKRHLSAGHTTRCFWDAQAARGRSSLGVPADRSPQEACQGWFSTAPSEGRARGSLLFSAEIRSLRTRPSDARRPDARSSPPL